jgi:uncharacterized protein with HEPN domain
VPHRDWKIRIHDILQSLEAILTYTRGMRFEDFTGDRKTVDAVIRNFIVIGEAAVHVPDDVCSNHPEIPWYEMRGMRNFVVHEYFGVSDKILWNTIKKDLPSLETRLKKLLGL